MKRAILVCLTMFAGTYAAAQSKEPIVIGLHADMSSASGLSGEAIRRGALIAISEINEKGGLLGGRELKLAVQDHHGVPARAEEQFPEFLKEKNLVAILSGIHSAAILPLLKTIHDRRIVFLDPWAAMTALIDNGYNPNYVFRISVRDQYVGEFLVDQAMKLGHPDMGLLLEQTAWGRGNEKSITEALEKKGKKPVGVEWFNWSDTDMAPQILNLKSKGADGIFLISTTPEGSAVVKSMAGLPREKRMPIISHWGIIGGDFVKEAGPALKNVDLRFLQTYSFIGDERPIAKEAVRRYRTLFHAKDEKEIFAPSGVAQSYDCVRVLALAIEKAQTIDGAQVRDALEKLESYSGLVREYAPPFSPERHEGLDRSDYRLAYFDSDGAIIPIRQKSEHR